MKTISAKALKELFDAKTVKIIDATLPPPSEAMFKVVSIPGAQYMRTGALKEAGPVPNIWPSAQTVAKRAAELGLKKSDTIALYEQPGKPGSARLWYILTNYGFSNVSVLDGGIAQWFSLGYPVAPGESQEPNGEEEELKLEEGALSTMGDIMSVIDNKSDVQLIDARPPSGFAGNADDNIEGCRQGKIPGAINLPPGKIQQAPEAGKAYKSAEEIAQIASDAGLDKSKKTIVYCRTGVAACTVLLGLQNAGFENLSMYDGSWSEWGTSEETKKYE